MLRKLLYLKHAVETIAIVFICVLGFILWQQINTVLHAVNSTVGEINKSVLIINRPETGTLAEITRLLDDTRFAEIKATRIIDHEERNLTALDAQEMTLFNDLHGVIRNGNMVVQSLNQTTNTLNTDLESVNRTLQDVDDSVKIVNAPNTGTLAQLNTVIGSTNTLISDPELHRILVLVESTSGHLNVVSDNFQKVTTNLEQQIDNPKKLSIWDKIRLGLDTSWKVGMLLK